jgi:hypothetical protein
MRRLVVPISFGLLAMLVLPALAHAAVPTDPVAGCGDAFSEYQDKGWLWM